MARSRSDAPRSVSWTSPDHRPSRRTWSSNGPRVFQRGEPSISAKSCPTISSAERSSSSLDRAFQASTIPASSVMIVAAGRSSSSWSHSSRVTCASVRSVTSLPLTTTPPTSGSSRRLRAISSSRRHRPEVSPTRMVAVSTRPGIVEQRAKISAAVSRSRGWTTSKAASPIHGRGPSMRSCAGNPSMTVPSASSSVMNSASGSTTRQSLYDCSRTLRSTSRSSVTSTWLTIAPWSKPVETARSMYQRVSSGVAHG